ncbi:MAG TPA: prenyltransferase [Spirochaetota bacterium]|nr:prenyltransferase [Spirochaetota bacterium]
MVSRELVKTWVLQIRSNFLLLAVFLCFIGLALAGLFIKKTGVGSFSVIDAIVLVLGVVIAHASVNLFNEYSDSQTGIDDNTRRTPFSGGTGLIQSGKTTPLAVSTAAWTTLFWAFLIGLYFTIMSHWMVMVIMIIGAVSIVFYTTHFARVLLGEFFAGLSLGSLVVIGAFVAMTGSAAESVCALFPGEVIILSVPPGILTFLLLFLNEFPDADVDKAGGRFHLVILLGRKKASYLYVAGLVLTYAFIIAAPLAGLSSWWVLLGCLTMPLAVKAGMMALRYSEDIPKLVPALGINVMVVLVTDLLLAVAIVLEMILTV